MAILSAAIASRLTRLSGLRSEAVPFLTPSYQLWGKSLLSIQRCPSQWKALGAEDDLHVNPLREAAWISTLVPARVTEWLAIRPETFIKQVLECPVCGSISTALRCKKDDVNRVLQNHEYNWTRTNPDCKAWEESAKAQGRTMVGITAYGRVLAGLAQAKLSSTLVTRLSQGDLAVYALGTFNAGGTDTVEVGQPIAILPPDGEAEDDTLYLLDVAGNTSPASSELMNRSARWAVEGALALDLVNHANNEFRTTVRVMVLPHADSPEPAFAQLTTSAVQRGRTVYQEGIAKYLAGRCQGDWPGYDRDGAANITWRATDAPVGL